jgi:transcriptional regulator with XRE-family HTH domain
MIAAVLRSVRMSNGLSVRELARLADVSPATIDRIEHQRVAPTRSVDQILESVGYRLVITAERTESRPPSREDQRSSAFHRLIAKRVLDEPEAVRAKAVANLATMRAANDDGSADSYFDRWSDLLAGADAQLLSMLLRTDDESRALRQVTPFAGVLSEAERATVYPRRHATRAT